MNENPSDEVVNAKVKRFIETYFETQMGVACSVRFYRNGSVAFVVSAKDWAHFNDSHAPQFDGLSQGQVMQLLDSVRSPSEKGPPPPDKMTGVMVGILEDARSHRGDFVQMLALRPDLVTLWRERLENSIRHGFIFQQSLFSLMKRAIDEFGPSSSETDFQKCALMLAALEYADEHPDAYADVEPSPIPRDQTPG